MSDQFMEILAGCTEAASTMDLNDNNWKPPDGPYTVRIEGVDTGTYTNKKTDQENIRVCPTFTIVDGEFEGRTFGEFFGIAPGATDIPSQIALKGLLQFATCIEGHDIRDPIEAVEHVKKAVGEFLSIEVWRGRPSKKGIVYANTRFMSKLESTEATT